MVMQGRKKERTLYWVIILLIIALAASLYYGWKITRQSGERFEQGVQLQGELDKVMDEYTTIKTENHDLAEQLSEKDSIIMAHQAEIKKLIASQADYRKIKKKLDLLRQITQEYVVRIDSLVTANQILEEENLQMREEVSRVNRTNSELRDEKRQLEDKVEVASGFKAYDVRAVTLRVRSDGKEINTDRAHRLTRISISFTLSENKIVEPGLKHIYARISRPDGVVLAMGEDDRYSFEMNGELYQYSIREDIEYRNEAMPVRMVWDRVSGGAAMSGKYDVMLYMDGREIGRTGFMVRD